MSDVRPTCAVGICVHTISIDGKALYASQAAGHWRDFWMKLKFRAISHRKTQWSLNLTVNLLMHSQIDLSQWLGIARIKWFKLQILTWIRLNFYLCQEWNSNAHKCYGASSQLYPFLYKSIPRPLDSMNQANSHCMLLLTYFSLKSCIVQTLYMNTRLTKWYLTWTVSRKLYAKNIIFH